MSLTLILWIACYLLLAVLAWSRPVWGVCLYFLSFFGDPYSWWWGAPVSSIQWNLIGALIAVVAALLQYRSASPWRPVNPQSLHVIAALIAMNATAVHFLLSQSLAVSESSYVLLLKLVILYALIVLSIYEPADLKVVLVALLIAAGHLGYEATINRRGAGGRLENFGPPAAHDSNALASLMTTILPLGGVLFLVLKGWRKAAVFVAVGLSVNVVLLCNSRGGFLAALASAVAFFLAVRGPVRRQVLVLLMIGAIGTLCLLRDDKITARFSTTFAAEEERDTSASSRLTFWKAGFRVIQDHPFGTGGDGFKKVHARQYIDGQLLNETGNRAVHNGFINEACEWGIQGLILRLLFVGMACLLTLRTQRLCLAYNDVNGTIIGASILAAFAAFLCTSMFGDRLDNEWGYWLAALSAGYANAYGATVPSLFPANAWTAATREVSQFQPVTQ